jgi:hypothetical protein
VRFGGPIYQAVGVESSRSSSGDAVVAKGVGIPPVRIGSGSEVVLTSDSVKKGSYSGRLCCLAGTKRLRLSRHAEPSLPLESNGWAVREGVSPPGGLCGQCRL